MKLARSLLKNVLYQKKAVRSILASIKARPLDKKYRSLLLSGPPGCGKTTAACAIVEGMGFSMPSASSLSCNVQQVDSGEILADNMRDAMSFLTYSPMILGEKILIVNEFDKQNETVQNILLDGLENLPPDSLVIATTNYPEKIQKRIRDRMHNVEFERPNQADLLAYAKKVLVKIDARKTLTGLPSEIDSMRTAGAFARDFSMGIVECPKVEPKVAPRSPESAIEAFTYTLKQAIPDKLERPKGKHAFYLSIAEDLMENRITIEDSYEAIMERHA